MSRLDAPIGVRVETPKILTTDCGRRLRWRPSGGRPSGAGFASRVWAFASFSLWLGPKRASSPKCPLAQLRVAELANLLERKPAAQRSVT